MLSQPLHRRAAATFAGFPVDVVAAPIHQIRPLDIASRAAAAALNLHRLQIPPSSHSSSEIVGKTGRTSDPAFLTRAPR
jgi:hypothetical protein